MRHRNRLAPALAAVLLLAAAPAASQEQPKLTAPSVTRSAEPVYPESKKATAERATVVLTLTVDEEGKVADAVVATSAGKEFDDAALAAAKQLVFAPATRDGKPVKARIPFRFEFAYEPPAAAAAAPQEPAKPARGVLELALKTAGDEPLAGATVTVTTADGATFTVTTDAKGEARIADVAAGKARVVVVAPGFETVTSSEDIGAGEAVRATYRPKAVVAAAAAGEIAEIQVVGERPPREVTRRTIEQAEVQRIPGTRGDALRAIEAMPGVARPPGLSGYLIVRGSGPNDTAVFVDGTQIPLAYHFGGLTSVVPTELLSRIDFLPGNFGPEYGRVMGGVVDVGLRSPRKDGVHGVLQLDLLDARIVGEAPLGKHTRFLAAARRSWVDAWLGPALESSGAVGVSTAPVYYDYQAILEQDLGEHTTARLAFLASDDRLVFTLKAPPSSDPGIGGKLKDHTRFWRIQARTETKLSDDTRWVNTLSFGEDHTEVSLGSLSLDIKANPLLARSDVRSKLSSIFTAVAGFDVQTTFADVTVIAPPIPKDDQDNGPFFALPSRRQTLTATLAQPAAYVMLETTPMRGVKLLPSVRADYSSDIKDWRVSPRLAARVDVQESPRTTIKGGIGLYHQPPQPYESYRPFGTPNLVHNRALHTSLGAEQELVKDTTVGLEGFYKKLDKLVDQRPDQSGQAGGVTYVNSGQGRIYGLEFLLRTKMDRFFGWVAYTLSRSERRATSSEEWRTFDFDQTHILSALGSYQLGRGWEVGARFRYVTGNPYTPATAAVYDADAGAYAPTYGKPFTGRDAAFHRLDLRVDKTWQFSDWKLTAYLDLQNAYNRQNPEGRRYNYNYSQSSAVSGLPLLPILGVRGEI